MNRFTNLVASFAFAMASLGCGCVSPAQPAPVVVQADNGRRAEPEPERARPLDDTPNGEVIGLADALRQHDLTIGEYDALARVRTLPKEYQHLSNNRIAQGDAASDLVVEMVDQFKQHHVSLGAPVDKAGAPESYTTAATNASEVARLLRNLGVRD
jgi:hypothetical protein